jgi:uncharacterized protein YndB with AHSA1/START domain
MTMLARSVEIDAPIETVFEFIADARNDSQWCSCVLSCDQRTGDGCGKGARYEAVHRPIKLRRALVRTIDVLAYDPPHRIRWRQEDADATFDIAYELEPTARGTRLTQHDRIHWKFSPGLAVFAVPFARALVRRRLASQMAALKRRLEQGSNAPTADLPGHAMTRSATRPG